MKLRYFSLLLAFHLSGIVFSVTTPSPLAKFKLLNQKGAPFQLSAVQDQNLFISFVYTRCPMPKMCPLTMQLNKQLYRKWKSGFAHIPLHFLIVTLDPENDSPAELYRYGKKFGLDFSRFTMLTGEAKALSDFAAEFNTLGFPGKGMISHNVKSALLGPNFTPIKEYKENEWTPLQVLKDLEQFTLQSAAQKKH